MLNKNVKTKNHPSQLRSRILITFSLAHCGLAKCVSVVNSVYTRSRRWINFSRASIHCVCNFLRNAIIIKLGHMQMNECWTAQQRWMVVNHLLNSHLQLCPIRSGLVLLGPDCCVRLERATQSLCFSLLSNRQTWQSFGGSLELFLDEENILVS